MGGQACSTNPSMHFQPLIPDLCNYMDMSLAENTKKAYQAGEKQYIHFCQSFQVNQVVPTNENTLCYFVVFLARTVKHSTIKSYLAGVKHLHLKCGIPLELESYQQLQYIMRGIKRSQGSKPKPRLPITIKHLHLFKEFLQPDITTNFDNQMLWSAICIAFFGFLRISEFTCDNVQRFHSGTLTRDDVQFYPDGSDATSVSLNIKASKTDPFRKGINLIIGATGSEICPVRALNNYLSTANPSTGPIFKYKNGKPLSRTLFTEEIRNLLSLGGLEPKHYAGHSFRIGAATTAAAVNIPAWLIKTMGRWSSDCFERYIRTPKDTLINASRQLFNEN